MVKVSLQNKRINMYSQPNEKESKMDESSTRLICSDVMIMVMVCSCIFVAQITNAARRKTTTSKSRN